MSGWPCFKRISVSFHFRLNRWKARRAFKRLRRDIVKFNDVMRKANYSRSERRRLKRAILDVFKTDEDIKKYEGRVL